MGKLIKAILFLILGVIGLVVLAGVLVPILFKEDIQKAADKAISQSIDAEVKYDIAALELSVFSNFPDVTVGLGEIAVIGALRNGIWCI